MNFDIERPSLLLQSLNLAKKHGYVVEINKISDNKSLTLFPNRLFGRPQYKHEELIHEVYKGKNGYTIKRNDSNEPIKFEEIPSYAVRSFILQDILMKCHLLGLSTKLVIGYNEKHEQVELLEAIPGAPDAKLEIEKRLILLYDKMTVDSTAIAEIKKLGIEHGIVLIDSYIKETVRRFVNQEI